MTTEEIIKKIPEIKLNPKNSKGKEAILQYYDGSWKYYSITEGKTITSRGSSTNTIYNYRSNGTKCVTGICYEYIPEINSVACMLCSLDTRNPIEMVPINWVVQDVFFITERKECITKYGDKWYVITEQIGANLPFSITEIPNIDNMSVNRCYPDMNDESLERAFKNLFPIVYIKTSTAVKLKTPNLLLQFLNFKEKAKKSGPKQQLIDELISIELEKVNPSELTGVKLERTAKTNYEEAYSFVKISPVKKGMCCLRYITKNRDNSLIENVRIYVDKKSAIACKKNNSNEYIQFRLCSGKDNFRASKIIDFKPEILEDTMLQYFGTIFSEIKQEHQSMAIWAFLQYPILEKLYKADLKEVVVAGFSNWAANPTSVLEDIFGSLDPKAKNINKSLGLNKHQLEKYKSVCKTEKAYVATGGKIIPKIKAILANGGNIDSIDDKTFDKLFDNYVKILSTSRGYSYDIDSVLEKLNTLYSTKTMLNLCDDVFNMYLESDTHWSSNRNYIRYYNDYLSTVKLLDDVKNYRPKFDTLDDIKEMHDAASAVYNLKREHYKLEAFMKQASKWEAFVYKGENFSVIAPKHPGEVANEGIVLHHCVKSYIDRIIDGRTNIVFIRKNDELDKPFFTVEITNDKTIQQVHGFGNRNADTEPGLEAFVQEWAKNNKLKSSNFNKIR